MSTMILCRRRDSGMIVCFRLYIFNQANDSTYQIYKEATLTPFQLNQPCRWKPVISIQVALTTSVEIEDLHYSMKTNGIVSTNKCNRNTPGLTMTASILPKWLSAKARSINRTEGSEMRGTYHTASQGKGIPNICEVTIFLYQDRLFRYC